jgi:protein-export membrane protein SecD
MVMFFMIVHYRLPGVVASGALIFYTLIVYALFRLIPVTMTLAGIAGFVLSVGMAVDANILIFERMKEELRWGKPMRQAVEAGFDRAWTSILDSNLSTIIICLILMVFGRTFGAQPVFGFALNLFIGVLVSMFTAVVVTRSLMRFVFERSGSETLRERQWLMGFQR